MGPLRSALAAARRQRRRRGVFVSLYRPCCGAAAAIARRRHGPAGPPNIHPPARPPSWWRARPPAATATGPRVGDSIFLPLSLPSRPALGPTDRPAAARPLPSAPPEAVASAHWRSPRLGFRARFPQGSRLCRRARSRVSVQYGCRALANASRLPILQPARSPEPTRPPFEAARLSLPVRASPPLDSVSTEWRRRRCCEQRDPRAAESSLCKAG